MTIFTEIIEGETRPGFPIFEDENHISQFWTNTQLILVTRLVIPKTPYEKIIDMPKDEVADLFSLRT